MTTENKTLFPSWLSSWMTAQSVPLWGAADLRKFATPVDKSGKGFPFAVSMVFPMDPHIMADIRSGPTEDYGNAYARMNERINEVSSLLAAEIRKRGHRSLALAASVRTDQINLRGDFPHKTAATRAGLGWIGRHCQLITRSFGPWVRLGTVFIDMDLPCGPPLERAFCGTCMICVEACPAGALKGSAWSPGLEREEMLDPEACDQWKKEHYLQYQQGRVCGICSAVCPYGLKTIKRARG
ncbi:MAG: 4Fe-4S ferredoxin, partial [Nitrospirae bacterium GWC1_57_7]